MKQYILNVYVLTGNLIWTCLAQKNLAPLGNVSQSSIYGQNSSLYGPQNALNEPKSNIWRFGRPYCTHTAGGETYSWWKIEFPSRVYISTVDLFYREWYASRMDGFRLSVTDDPKHVKTTEVCYKDKTDGTAKITQTIDCHKHGKFLLYDKYVVDNRRKEPFIELCYVGINGCLYGFWGVQCNKTCQLNCVGGNCVPENGQCVWGSHYKNLALNSTVLQVPHDSNYSAELAVDGNTSTCVNSRGSDVWLQIDLQQISVISIVHITLEDTVHPVYSIFASNTSWNETSLIQADNSSLLLYEGTDFLVNLSKIAIAKFLIFVPNQESGHKSIIMCEFEARGCVAGMFGEYCNETCEVNCDGPCDINNGRCIFGCKDGWLGDFCGQACTEGFYGNQCQQNCSMNCLQPPCNHVTGSCDGGCSSGWISHNCTEECDTGKYGLNCSESCDGCVSDDCDNIDGLCRNTTSCKPGYLFGEKCDKACISGSYGHNCEQNCSTCFNMTCDSTDGTCTTGCISGYNGLTCEFTMLARENTISTNLGIVGGGIAALALVLIVVVAVYIFRRRRTRQKKTQEREDPRTDENINLYINESKSKSDQYINVSVTPGQSSESFSEGKEGFVNVELRLNEEDDEYIDIDVNVYGNVQKDLPNKQFKIRIEELENTIKEKRKGDGFKVEFELLPKGMMLPHHEGSKEINKTKNRYKTTWPYDHSRVILKDDSKHDYINANYIDSYTKEKAYIASQGPKKNTVRDFWHMVWQENVNIIVMVTNIEEGGRPKCEQYWPSEVNSPMVLDIYRVVLTSEKRHSVYDYRCTSIIRKKTDKQRKLHHFHFTQWPDHGVPDTVKLVEFYRKVKRQCYVQEGPMLVHCSAGVGRTGTFIAMDALHSYGKTTGEIDVMEYLQIMRKDRVNMIQTHEQYMAVFEALLELFTVPDTSIPMSDFCRFFEEQDQASLPSNQKLHRKQFQRLQSMRPSYTKDLFAASCHPNNSTKNHDTSILAHDKYRPYLTSYGRNSNDYINAIIIPGFLLDNGFLVSQCPLNSTVMDFWTMIYDHDCELVVLMDNPNINAQILPDDDKPFLFENLSVHKENDISKTDECVILEDKTNKKRRKVYVVTYNNWNKDTLIPTSTHLFIDFHKKMKDYGKKCAGKVTVVCRDGCSKCGLYIAISLVLEKMELDSEVDIFQIVRTIQVRRPEFLSHFEQYEFCYKFVRDCLIEEESLYANT